MTNPQPDTCVQCGGELAFHVIPQMMAHIIALLYCPNPACPNYGLVTVGKGGVDA